MKKNFVWISVLLLAACAEPWPNPFVEPQTDTGSFPVPQGRDAPNERAIETVPLQLSIAHFSTMQLVGTGLTLETVLAENSAYTRYQISYRSNGLRISGIMNIPKGEGPFPLIVLNHGFIAPSVYTVGRGLKREQDFLARHGFAVLHTDYRGHGESDPSPDTRMVYDAGLEYSMDSANAINAVRQARLPNVDSSRVGMLGHSLGGGVTLNIATAHPEMLDAAVLYAPVHSDAWENFVRWRDMREEGDRTRALMGTREENPNLWNALSSLSALNAIDDPILLFHGTKDSDVPIEWSEFLEQKLMSLRKEIEFITYEGEKHEFVAQWEDFMERTVTFFAKHLSEAGTPLSVYDKTRITKKPFGIFIEPDTSPVQPELFTGYHTGTDFEVFPSEDETKIRVSALCNGTVEFRDWVRGYGGVLVQSCTIDSAPVTVLYGHLNVDSIELQSGNTLRQGDHIGNLGKGYSPQTSGERPHLHLSVHRGNATELRGYVQSAEELSAWADPLSVFDPQ